MINNPGRMLFVRSYITLLVLAFLAGAAIMAGGKERFSSPSFAGPRGLAAPLWGEPWQAWGLVFLVCGGLLLWSFGRKAAINILRVVSVGYLFFAVSLGASVFDNPVASALGVVVFVPIALFHLFSADYLSSNGWE